MPDLYGKLNKEVRIYNYDGVETDTAKVTVDNKTQDISVDVKKVPNELTLTTINGDTYTYDGSEPASFDIRTQVTDKVEEGNNLPVTSDAVKGYVDSKAGALEYVGGEGNFTNINGGVTVKGRLNVDDGIYSPVTSDDPNFVPNNKSVDDKITASEQKLIDERIGAFTRTEDKLFTDVTGGMTIKGKLNVDGGITSPTEPTSSTDVANKGYVDDRFVHKGTTLKAVYAHDENGNESMVNYTENATSGTLVQRAAGGIVKVGTPLSARDAVTKEYVDDADAKKLNLTGGTITGSLAIQGDLAVTGTTTTEKAQTLAVKDSVIVTNADGAELGATLSGIAIRKDGENTYGVMYDPSGDSVKLGLGTLDAENNFTFNDSGTDGKAIATRADSSVLTDGDLVKWDGTTNSLVDSGKTIDDFVAKIGKETQAGTILYGRDFSGNEKGFIVESIAHSASSIVQRKSGGAVEVGTAVEDSDAMPKKQVDDNFRKRFTVGAGEYAYIANARGDGSLQIDGNPTAQTIAKRVANGRLQVGAPSDDADATTKAYVDNLNTITITAGA